MKGQMTIIPPTGEPVVTEHTEVPRLKVLQKAVGGYIEVVPGFQRYRGKPCTVFCNENGKNDGLEFNERATLLWHQQVRLSDVLVGSVVILTGDAEFMGAL